MKKRMLSVFASAALIAGSVFGISAAETDAKAVELSEVIGIGGEY